MPRALTKSAIPSIVTCSENFCSNSSVSTLSTEKYSLDRADKTIDAPKSIVWSCMCCLMSITGVEFSRFAYGKKIHKDSPRRWTARDGKDAISHPDTNTYSTVSRVHKSLTREKQHYCADQIDAIAVSVRGEQGISTSHTHSISHRHISSPS